MNLLDRALIGVSFLTKRSGIRSASILFYFKRRRRAPTFRFALEESLLTFQLNNPALVPLFQLPPTRATSHLIPPACNSNFALQAISTYFIFFIYTHDEKAFLNPLCWGGFPPNPLLFHPPACLKSFCLSDPIIRCGGGWAPPFPPSKGLEGGGHPHPGAHEKKHQQHASGTTRQQFQQPRDHPPGQPYSRCSPSNFDRNNQGYRY
jgi:hypothetical protein